MIWLPVEVLEQILGNLDYPSLVQTCLVSSSWYHVITSLDKVWYQMTRRCQITLHHDNTTLRPARWYRDKIRVLERRCRHVDIKGYPFDEETDTLDIKYISSTSQHILILHGANELSCYDVITWAVTSHRQLEQFDDVTFLECGAQWAAVGALSGNVGVYDVAEGLKRVEMWAMTSLSRDCDIKCVRIEEETGSVAMVIGDDVIVYKAGQVICHVQDVGSFNWTKHLWDGKRSKDGIYDNILQFAPPNQLAVITTRKLCLVTISPLSVTETGVTDNHGTCANPNKCYFWPSILVSHKYYCCRTACGVRLYSRQNGSYIRTFSRQYAPNERLVFPSDRANIVGIGSKFLVAVDPHFYPRILLFDVESGAEVVTVGDNRNECESQLPIYHGIYHMSYFVKFPSRSWLDGDFEVMTSSDHEVTSSEDHVTSLLPCIVTYKHKDYLSEAKVWIFHFENFHVRTHRSKEFYDQCSKVISKVVVSKRINSVVVNG